MPIIILLPAGLLWPAAPALAQDGPYAAIQTSATSITTGDIHASEGDIPPLPDGIGVLLNPLHPRAANITLHAYCPLFLLKGPAVEKLDIGEVSKYKISIVYLKNYVYEGFVEEIKALRSRIR